MTLVFGRVVVLLSHDRLLFIGDPKIPCSTQNTKVVRTVGAPGRVQPRAAAKGLVCYSCRADKGTVGSGRTSPESATGRPGWY